MAARNLIARQVVAGQPFVADADQHIEQLLDKHRPRQPQERPQKCQGRSGLSSAQALMNWATNHRRRKEKLGQLGDNPKDPEAETVKREGEAPAEPEANRRFPARQEPRPPVEPIG